MSPKEIAAHLEMPVGEVELIFSLHKRLSGETAKSARQLPADVAVLRPANENEPPPRIIAAENVDLGGNQAVMPESGASSERRFQVVGHDDGDDSDENRDGGQVA
jgi:hypothetical protein